MSAASPVPAGRLRALAATSPGFTAADAQAIWSALKAADLIDANNYPKSLPKIEAVRAALPAALQNRAADVLEQLAIGFAAQQFYSDANARVIRFLDSRAASSSGPAPGRIVNVSTRTKIDFLGDTFSVGFTLAGAPRATLLIRAVGPGLSRFGVGSALPAPRLELSRGNTLLTTNEGWDNAATVADITTAAAAVGAFPLPRGSLDTAMVVTLEPGTYTATIKSINGAVGDVVAEVYDVSRNQTRLTTISVLAKIGTDGELLIPGIVIAGNNPRTLALRAVGPGLTDLGYAPELVLRDPRLAVVNSAGQPIATNNDWAQAGAGSDPTLLNMVFAAAGAFPLKPASADAALVHPFAPGSYLLQTGSAPAVINFSTPASPSATGAVLVEIYEVP
jgi:hypothetical protein